jgi:translation initiation factor 1 (eIF-1/SUI1)|uniref:SUI1 domain-containing protein n=1 Tax=viral metagenome TaxID=1070528 RepID=A0A6C0H8N0_9ZZZZ
MINPFEQNVLQDNDIKNIIDNNIFIEIWMEKNKKKKITYITGWNLEDSLLKTHIQNIKRKHGCNGTLKNDKMLMFQGNQIINIKQYIINNGIDINNIHIKG